MYYTKHLLELKTKLKENYYHLIYTIYTILLFTKTHFRKSQELIRLLQTLFWREQKNNSKNPEMRLDLLSALKNSHKQIKSINIKNKAESNLEIIAETFNNFFVTIAGDIDSKIVHTDINYKYYLHTLYLNRFS